MASLHDETLLLSKFLRPRRTLFDFLLLWCLPHAQGLDALGVATVDSFTNAAASRLPFVAPLSSSLMADEDVENLRTLRRLLLLLSRLQKDERLSSVSIPT